MGKMARETLHMCWDSTAQSNFASKMQIQDWVILNVMMESTERQIPVMDSSEQVAPSDNTGTGLGS